MVEDEPDDAGEPLTSKPLTSEPEEGDPEAPESEEPEENNENVQDNTPDSIEVEGVQMTFEKPADTQLDLF